MPMKDRRSFSEEYKRETVRRAMEPGAIRKHIEEELDLSSSVLSRWIKDVKGGKKARTPVRMAVAVTRSSDKGDGEFARLRGQVAKLTRERDALKKALAVYLEEGE